MLQDKTLTKYKTITSFMKASGVLVAMTAGLFLIAHSSKAEMYLQGAYGYGMVSDFEGTENGSSVTKGIDEDPTVMGIEVGQDHLGVDQKIRLGAGYQAMDITLDDGSEKATTIYSVNGYYFIGDKARDEDGIHPYVGGGLLLVDFEDDAMKFGIAGHAGAEMPVGENLLVGGKYSYIFADGSSGSEGSTTYAYDNFTAHILSATATYQFEGGLGLD